MRTPKEEAKELYEKFFLQTQYHINLGSWDLAQENAIICVNKILDAVTTIADKKFEHYTEVKQEIEKL